LEGQKEVPTIAERKKGRIGENGIQKRLGRRSHLVERAVKLEEWRTDR